VVWNPESVTPTRRRFQATPSSRGSEAGLSGARHLNDAEDWVMMRCDRFRQLRGHAMTRVSRSLIVSASLFLLVLASLHFAAFTMSAMRANAEFAPSARLALLFALYYLSWIGVFIANFYLLSRFLPVFGNGFVFILFIAGVFVWIPCATVVDHTLFHMDYTPVTRILRDANPLGYFQKFLIYCYMFGGIAALVYYRLYQTARVQMLEREKEAAEAKVSQVQQTLTALQLQLAPHFLFNCLNMLSALTRMGKRDELLFVIARLGDMLRFVSGAGTRNIITLHEEIEFVENYVKLQRARFGDRFNFHMDVVGDAAGVSCPPFCLHTLVENAYTHTMPEAASTEIAVRIDIGESSVCIAVRNSGPAEERSPKLGIGLSNLNDRMTLLYGSRYHLGSASDQESYTAQMEFPHESQG
jgi:sensor histidine kinase YesM